MDHPSDGKRERSDRDARGRVQRDRPRYAAPGKVFVSDVHREDHGARDPRRQSPRLDVRCGRGEQSAYEEIHKAGQKGGANPRSMRRGNHERESTI